MLKWICLFVILSLVVAVTATAQINLRLEPNQQSYAQKVDSLRKNCS